MRLNAEEMVFDMIGVDASIVNAFRRILLAEVCVCVVCVCVCVRVRALNHYKIGWVVG